MARLRVVVPGVLVATSRREATTTTVVATGDRAEGVLLVDPCWEPDELAGIGSELAAMHLSVGVGLATHAHYDHLLWHPSFGDPPRYASAETARRARAERGTLLAGLGAEWPEELVSTFARVHPVSGPSLPWDGPDVVLVVHDAHLPGHTAAWIPHLAVLVAGDMLSDVELPLPDDSVPAVGDDRAPERGDRDPLVAYLEGLERLTPYVARAGLVVPGHGTPTADGSARLDADRRYIDALLAGRPCDDPRLANPGMAEAHRRSVALADVGPGGR